MELRYIDAHCHLQFEQYDADREAIIEKMREEGVGAVVVGTSLESSCAAVALAEQHEHLFASIGIHPNELNVGRATSYMRELRELAQSAKVVGVGECGLDYFRPEALTEETKMAQKELFTQQVALAAERDLPLVIHARPSKGAMDAYHDIAAILKEAKAVHPNLRGDMHFFAGGVAEAEAFVALDFTLSFTAVITFARDYDAVIRAVLLTSLLAETDAPYVAPASRRGEQNDPFAVLEVVAELARIRGDDPETVRQTLLANTRRLFTL
jgi:TatD DNase family protein